MRTVIHAARDQSAVTITGDSRTPSGIDLVCYTLGREKKSFMAIVVCVTMFSAVVEAGYFSIMQDTRIVWPELKVEMWKTETKSGIYIGWPQWTMSLFASVQCDDVCVCVCVCVCVLR